MRVPKEEFLQLDLHAHSILRGVPLKDVTAIDLPGGGEGRTISEIMALSTPDELTSPNGIVRFLFWLRYRAGAALQWEAKEEKPGRSSFLPKIEAGIRLQSRLEPGTREGPFRMLYVLPNEALGEIENKTVHAFLCSHLRRVEEGYRLYWGIFILPTSWFTPVYLAVIEPFRKYLVYPAIFRKIRKAWVLRLSDKRVPH